MKGLILSGGRARGCGPSPTPAPSSWCRSPTSRSSSTASRRSSRPASPTSASSSARPAPEVMAAVGDGSRLGRDGHLHPAGRAARPGARGADRARLPRRRRLRHVPRRQPAQGGHRAVRATQFSAEASPRRRSCWRTCPNPQQFGVAELDATGAWCAWSRSRRTRRATSRWSASTCSARAIFDAVAAIKPSARGELEITDAIQWLIDTGYGVTPAHHQRLVEGHRQARGHAGGQPARSWTRSSRVSRATSDADVAASRARWSSRRRGSSTRTVRGPAIIGRERQSCDAYVGPFTSVADDCSIGGREIEHSICSRARIDAVTAGSRDSLIGSAPSFGAASARAPTGSCSATTPGGLS